MKTKIIIVVLTLTFACTCVGAPNVSIPPTDPSIQTFWATFKVAVTKGDKEAVASMTQFPVEMPYGVPPIRTRAQLLKRYREVFNVQADAVKCFATAAPKIDDRNKAQFEVGCKDRAGNEVVVYGFGKKRGVWKLISLDNINE
jgi:hypothetical protein